MSVKFKLIFGLGNPGEEYGRTYHNAGQLFLSHLMKREVWNTKQKLFWASRFDPLAQEDATIYLAKSLTFMNDSGKAVAAALEYFKIKPRDLLLVHDDSDIELGKYKISFGRGSAGHRGVESVIRELGNKNFWRLRIGIRKKSNLKSQKSKMRKKAGLSAGARRAKVGDWVLRKISPEEHSALKKTFKKAASLFGVGSI